MRGLVSGACGKKPDAVFIITADAGGNIIGGRIKQRAGSPLEIILDLEGSNIIGEPRGTFNIDEDQTKHINIEMSDNVVVFRQDGTFEGLAGKSGKAYRISEGCTLMMSEGSLREDRRNLTVSLPSKSTLIMLEDFFRKRPLKRLSGDCKLIEIGTVDISKSNSDIAAKFGVYEKK